MSHLATCSVYFHEMRGNFNEAKVTFSANCMEVEN